MTAQTPTYDWHVFTGGYLQTLTTRDNYKIEFRSEGGKGYSVKVFRPNGEGILNKKYTNLIDAEKGLNLVLSSYQQI